MNISEVWIEIEALFIVNCVGSAAKSTICRITFSINIEATIANYGKNQALNIILVKNVDDKILLAVNVKGELGV